MAFLLSPGVKVNEIALDGFIPAVSTTAVGFCGTFQWGEIKQIVDVENEGQLVSAFGKPDDATASSFFTAADFLSYGDRLRLVRVDNGLGKNATAKSGSAGLRIENAKHYSTTVKDDAGTTFGNFGVLAAKHVGTLGNSLKMSICPSAAAMSNTLTAGSTDLQSSGTAVETAGGTGGDFTSKVIVGSIIVHPDTGEERKITAVTDDDNLVIESAFTTEFTGKASVVVKWEYADQFGYSPATSPSASASGTTNDEMHIVIVDEDGQFSSGVRGTVLERWTLLSKCKNLVNESGDTNYYADVLSEQSKYVYFVDDPSKGTNWSADGTTGVACSESDVLPITESFEGGTVTNTIGDAAVKAQRLDGYDLFASPDAVDVSILMLGEADATVVQYVIQNICETRLDCIAVFSPEKADVVNAADPKGNVIAYRDTIASSKYAFMTDNWKWRFDRYNRVSRYTPMDADSAGLMVRTDQQRDSWFSPAGLNRGIVKNANDLAWDSTRAQRDDMYTKNINSFRTKVGVGIVLFGDKVLLSRPSVMESVSVRRLLIFLEKAISIAAEYLLFEQNNALTRLKFVSQTEEFLKTIVARQGLEAYSVICDSRNNPPEAVQRKEFVGDIFIVPVVPINFIQLNFNVVGNTARFEEIIGSGQIPR